MNEKLINLILRSAILLLLTVGCEEKTQTLPPPTSTATQILATSIPIQFTPTPTQTSEVIVKEISAATAVTTQNPPDTSPTARAKPPGQAGKPGDKYACAINAEGYCIFEGIPHKTRLKPNTKDIVDRNGAFLFFVQEAVAVNSSGKILQAKGTPAFNGDELIKHSKDGMTNDEKAFHKVMAIMFPIRNALMYDIADINQVAWDELIIELKVRGIKDKTFTNGTTPKDNYYGRHGVFELTKNPNGRDIHHDIMKFLEEAGLYLLCHVTSDDFGQMLEDTHPEGHNPCKDAGIISKIPFST